MLPIALPRASSTMSRRWRSEKSMIELSTRVSECSLSPVAAFARRRGWEGSQTLTVNRLVRPPSCEGGYASGGYRSVAAAAALAEVVLQEFDAEGGAVAVDDEFARGQAGDDFGGGAVAGAGADAAHVKDLAGG